MSTVLRTSRAQTIINALDTTAAPATLAIMSGGQPDPSDSVAIIAAHSISNSYVNGSYVAAVGHYYRAENSGTSAGTAPGWPVDGSTVTDNDITWQDMGIVPVLLGTLTFSKPSGSVTEGVITFAAIAGDVSADAGGVATWARAADGDANQVMDLTVGGIGSGADIELNTTSIVAGGPLRVTSATLTEGGM
jgi:hypothetical protein